MYDELKERILNSYCYHYTISKTIRPKMSKQSEDDYHVSEEKEQLQKENASKEESVEDISSLINSAQLLTECNSQLTPERKAEILQTFLFLSKPTVNQSLYDLFVIY